LDIAVDLPESKFPISLVTLRDRTLTPVVERFIEFAAQPQENSPNPDTRR
jgi:hypothetical protein